MVIHLETAGEPAYPVENLRYQPLKHMRVALVLSGGGARGFAHIGVLKAFEEYQIPIDLIVGTSIGSIVGGFYAAGFSAEEIRRIVQEIDWNSIFVDQAYRNQLFWAQKHIPRRHILQFRFDGLLPAIPASISQGQKI
ncbi:MAG: patatin-like phospholipase family protein, partial [Calditrichaeota bacterium]|nr:patatin-like phospholipase family protein [Calditrichota bacterium]